MTFLFLLSLGRLLIPPPSVHVHARQLHSTNCENPHNEYMYEASPCHGTNNLIKSQRAEIKTLCHSVGATSHTNVYHKKGTRLCTTVHVTGLFEKEREQFVPGHDYQWQNLLSAHHEIQTHLGTNSPKLSTYTCTVKGTAPHIYTCACTEVEIAVMGSPDQSSLTLTRSLKLFITHVHLSEEDP